MADGQGCVTELLAAKFTWEIYSATRSSGNLPYRLEMACREPFSQYLIWSKGSISFRHLRSPLEGPYPLENDV